MSADVEPRAWDELPDLMTYDEFRGLVRMGDRQSRRFAKENNLEVRLGNSCRVSKAAFARYLRDELGEDVFDGETSDDTDADVLDFPEAAGQ